MGITLISKENVANRTLRFVNGRPAAGEELVRYPIHNSSSGAADLHTSTLGLRFTVADEHFPRGGGDGRVRVHSD